MGLVIGTGGLHIGTSGGGASPVKRFDAEAEYIKRKAGGTDNIGTGKAKIPTLKGKSQVWNQLIQNGNFADGTTGWQKDACTISASDNVLSIMPSSNYSRIRRSDIGFVVGHKYLFAADIKKTSEIEVWALFITGLTDTGATSQTISPASEAVNSWKRYYCFATALALRSPVIYVCDSRTTSTTDTRYVRNVQLIDLTLMFGAGNEPSTVAEFEAMYPLPYYEYNAGEIINNKAEAIETVGFNQWDEEWEVGGYTSQGVKQDFSNSFRCKNLIPVIPNWTYYFKVPYGVWYVNYYDASGNWIGYGGMRSNNISLVIPANVYYVTVWFYNAGTTYNNDICINISDAARNGTYEPYEKYTLQLGLNSFNVKDSGGNIITVNGLKSAGSAYDEIDLARGKYIKRVGAVDMGTLEWTKKNPDSGSFFSAEISSKADAAGRTAPSDLVCAKYRTAPVESYSSGKPNKVIEECSSTGVKKAVHVTDVDTYSDATTFTTAMSGVMLYYELATPEEYDLVTPIGNSYKVISGGTEERLPRDTASSVMAPIKYSVKYVQPKE